ncbi:tetratricopeptide repeat-containing sensor histidine kinase [Chitinophaga filiformis]|uniref:sensor histidine kinase n=1 Tax=Chitinophaga filiformis TaxID=104663 RepID=UPI001F30C431|nr:tetratricopeptide repeat-containing sensor histidine kinase [Chitinophaga filiformis]MCF6407893.1 tetratricopeptide repeat-containing sensor histidine kinase [Chitinophaga filiformis]
MLRFPCYPLLILFLCCSALNRVSAQKINLPVAVRQLITQQCNVCNQLPAGQDSVVSRYFHQCHAALDSGNLDDGFKYASTITAITDSNSLAPRTLTVKFLKAKILYYKDFYKEALSEYLKLTAVPALDINIQANIYPNIGEIYLEQRQFNTSLAYFNLIQQRFFHLYEPVVARKILNNTGVCLLHMARFKEAEEKFEKSIAIAAELKDTTALVNSFLNTALLYDQQVRQKEAWSYLQRALALAKKASDLKIRSKVYLNFAIVEERTGHFQSALAYRKEYEQLEAQIANRDKIWELAEQEKKIAIQQQEYKLQLLRQENKLRAAELTRRRWQRNTFFVLSLFFLSCAGLIFFAYRQTQKRNRIIAEQNDKLELLNETKDQLFSIVAHDLRSPVNHLKINLSYLKDTLARNKIREATALSENIEKISDNTYALLNNLLYWSLGQTGQLSLHPEPHDANRVIAQVVYDFNAGAALKRITIINEVPAGMTFLADLNTVKIIFRNIIDNAIKYTHPSGTITISGQTNGNGCEITVQDTGIGMDEKIIQAIYKRDTKRIQQDTAGSRSTGLGLWLVKAMTEKNGGALRITGSVGAGTTIVVCLPANKHYEGTESTHPGR